MKQYLLIGLGLCLLNTVGFSQTVKPPTDNEFYFVTSDNKKIELGIKLKQLFTILGPTTVKPSKKFRSKNFQYDWKGFTAYMFTENNTQEACLLMEVTGKQFATPRGIRVGDTAQKVKQKYGTPKIIENEFLYRSVDSEESTGMGFTIKNGVVSKIIYGTGT